MNTRNIIITVLGTFFLGMVSNCKKDPFGTEPYLILKYETQNTLYNKTASYRSGSTEKYALIPFFSGGSVAYLLGTDSVGVSYSSTLVDSFGKPSLSITISKTFHKNQIEILPSGKVFTKNPDDFYALFKTGKVEIQSENPTYNRLNGLNISLQDSTLFVFQDSPGNNLIIPVPAYQDSSNYFEITAINTGPLYLNSILPANSGITSYNAAIVTFKFKCIYITQPSHIKL